MIRLTLLWLFIGYLGVTAWKDWHRSLCGLILLMGVYKHPDMPKSVFDVPGLNPWNILLIMVVIAWLFNRRNELGRWDMPSRFNNLLWFYFLTIVISFFRMIVDLEGLESYTITTGWLMPSTIGFWNDYLFNTIKWVVPGIILFDGCRTDAQIKMALAAILGTYLILALQVIQYVPISTLLSGIDLGEKTIAILSRNVHYHRTDLAIMLAGAFWSIFSVRKLFPFKGALFFFFPLILLILLLALALTGGRAGYLAWVGIAFLFCLFRYRKLLFVLPIVIAIALPYSPTLINRITEGLNGEDGVDQNTLTAGRSVAWPLVIEKISEAPILGYGREAMKRTGISSRIYLDYMDSAPHPHNAYLELLLDNGLIGFIIIIPFFWLVIKNSLSLFCANDNLNYRTVGGVSLALVGAHLIGSLTGQTFYPREVSFGMWCSIGLLLRMVVAKSNEQTETIA